MTLQELLEKQWGVKTDMRVNPIVAQVETTKTQLLKPNPNRLAWTLINLGDNQLHASFEPDVSNEKGVYVSATGGVFGLLWSEDFILVTYPVWAIATTAAAKVYLVEVVSI